MRNTFVVVRRAVFWLGLAALVTLVVRTMFYRGTPSAPTEAEARAVLAEHAAAVAKQPPKEAYCFGDERYTECLDDWEDAGGDAARPVTPPVVMSVRGGTVIQIFDICGKDGLGRPYVSGLRFHRVHRGEGEVSMHDRVYWRNNRLGRVPPEGLPAECR